jgi:hypothetical protein
MSKSSIILIISVIALFGAAGYLLFGQSEVSGVMPEDTAATQAELTFLSLAARINPIEFDSSIVNDPRFMALQDIGIAIVEESQGRVDPFAPLGR